MKPFATARALPVPRAELGEGPFWSPAANRIWWVDIAGRELRAYCPADDAYAAYGMPSMVGFAVGCADGERFVVGLEGRLALCRIENGGLGAPDELCGIEPDLPENRCNDGKCDPAGRLWFGTMHREAKEASGRLYRYDGRGRPAPMLDGLTIANGMAWSADGRTFFFTDSATREIRAYDFDAHSGRIANGRTVIRVPEKAGLPDGMAADARDRLWIAHWGEGCVRCWDPASGEPLAEVRVPATNTTSCAFGGPDGTALFITSAADNSASGGGDSSETPGGLFRVSAGVAGGTVHSFAPPGA